MSTSAPRYHIPFPKNWLSLNATPSKLPTPEVTSPIASPTPLAPRHSFLSNKPSGRHFSVSSTSSAASTVSTFSEPSSPPSKAVDAAQMNGVPAFQTWLTLNAKFNGPARQAAVEMANERRGSGGFLSNRG